MGVSLLMIVTIFNGTPKPADGNIVQHLHLPSPAYLMGFFRE